jgi:hypothetical protein
MKSMKTGKRLSLVSLLKLFQTDTALVVIVIVVLGNVPSDDTYGKGGNDGRVGTPIFGTISKSFEQLFIRHVVDIHSTML